MSRVFTKPRYTNQARNKLVALAVATENPKLVRNLCSKLKMNDNEISSAAMNYGFLVSAADNGGDFDEMMPSIDLPLESYLLDSEIGRLSSQSRLMRNDAAKKVVRDALHVFDKFKPEVVLTDDRAIFYLINYALSDDAVFTENKMNKMARTAAQSTIFYQLMPQKIAPGMWHELCKKFRFSSGISSVAIRMEKWIKGAENLQYRAHPMWVKYCRIWAMGWTRMKSQTASMIDKVKQSKPEERFLIDSFNDCTYRDTFTAYNWNGTLVLFVNEVCLILDNSAADLLRQSFTSIRNADIAFENYRLTGDTEKYALYPHLQRCYHWLKKHLRDPYKSSQLARHMHLSYVRWLNSVGEQQSRIKCGHDSRDESLREDIIAWYPYTTEWYDLVMSFPVAERTRVEFLKLYHILPPPDINPVTIHEELVKKSHMVNKCDEKEISKFLDFCKSYDLCRYISKNKEVPKMKHDEGYDYENKKWFQKCMSGKFSMPVEEEWGKVQMFNHFPYDFSGDFHIFDAQDVTRVVADLDKYMDRHRREELSNFDTNELLSAIFKGPKLSNGELMSEFRDRVFNGELTDKDQFIAMEAGKAENTKPGTKVRETLSGCDTVREFLTEVDHSIRPLAAQTPGVSIRIDAIKHKRKFQKMASYLSRYCPQVSFSTSTDITGWSPLMPRKMFHAWQEYALSTTQCPNPKAVRSIWDKMVVFCDRRGVKLFDEFKDGTFQGWPATSDTTMHAHILIYWAYQLRLKKILSEKEAAYTLCLIDDAATTVVLDSPPEEAKEKAENAKDMLVKLYSSLGFKMDEIKSFFSSIKFIYLNELYLDGSQVFASIKTMMKVDKDHTRRFSSLNEQIAVVMGMVTACASSGNCPFFSYWFSLWMAFRFVYETYPKFAELSSQAQFIAMMTPCGMNGFGVKPIVSTLSTGNNDNLTWFLEICEQLLEFDFAHLVEAVLKQEIEVAKPLSVFKNPFGLEVAGHSNTTEMIANTFREAARTQKMAEPFFSLDKYAVSNEYIDAVTHMLECGAWEATLLEEVSQNMPDSFVSEMMSRVDKTEIVAALLSSAEIGKVRRRIRQSDINNVTTMYDLLRASKRGEYVCTKSLKEIGSFAYANQMRKIRNGEYQILNCTFPCPFQLWAFNGTIEPGTERALRMTTVNFSINFISTAACSSGNNLYDSVMGEIGYKGYRSSAASLQTEAKIQLYNPIKRKIAAGLAALRWAKYADAHYHALTDLFLYSWSGRSDVRLLDLPGYTFSGSAKRLSLRHLKNNHMVFPFPNVQAAVRVDAKAITRQHASSHHMYDVMAAITALRTSGLLEAALGMKFGVSHFCYAFTYKPSSEASLQVPSTFSPKHDENIFKKVKPFTEISSDLRDHARKLCSYKVMEQVLQTYMASSELVATQFYENVEISNEVDYNEWEFYEPVVERIKFLERTRRLEDLPRSETIYLTSTARPKDPQPIVVTENVKQQVRENPVITTVAMTDWEALNAYGKMLTDSSAIDLANAMPQFAHRLNELANKDMTEDIIDDEEFQQARKWMQLDTIFAREIVKRVKEMASAENLSEAVTTVLTNMGIRGWRSGEEDNDIIHSLDSFFGRTSSIVMRARAIGKSLNKLRGKERYSAKTVLGAHLPAHAISSVIKAQWRLAAARYEARSAEIVKAQGNTTLSIELNYKSVFLNAFSDCVTTTGIYLRMPSYTIIPNLCIRSSLNYMKNEELRVKLTDALIANGIYEVCEVQDEQEMLMIIEGICIESNLVQPGFDFNAIKSAYEEVKGWVDADTKGEHQVVKVVSKYRKSYLSAPTEPKKRIVPILDPEVPDAVTLEMKVSNVVVPETPMKPRLSGVLPGFCTDLSGTISLKGKDVVVEEKIDEQKEATVEPKKIVYAVPGMKKYTGDMVILMPTTVVIPDEPIEDPLAVSNPHDVMQWIFEHPDVMEWLRVHTNSRNRFVSYDAITKDISTWRKFIEDFKASGKSEGFVCPEYSSFPSKWLEDMESGGQERWVED